MTSSTPPFPRDWYDLQHQFSNDTLRREAAAGDFASFRDGSSDSLRGEYEARLQVAGQAYGLFAVMSRPERRSKAQAVWIGPLAKSVEAERRRIGLPNDVAAQGDTHQEVIVRWTSKLGNDATGNARRALDTGYDNTLKYLRRIVKNIVREADEQRRRPVESLDRAKHGHTARRPSQTAAGSRIRRNDLSEDLVLLPAGIFKRPEALYLLGHCRTAPEELAEQMGVDREEVARKRHELVYLPIREYVRRHHPDWLE